MSAAVPPSPPAEAGNKAKTFKLLKNYDKNGKMKELRAIANASLSSGNMRAAVQLPDGENLNEWLALNTVDFFNEMSLLYGSIVEFCTDEACPVMSAGEHQYLWADGVAVKKPIAATAPQYVDYLMGWVDGIINDEALFPTGKDHPFPPNFLSIVRTIFKRLFRVYAHLYHSHFDQITSMGAEDHLNACFKHFIFFTDEFALVEEAELEPLKDLIQIRLAEEQTTTTQDLTKEQSYLSMDSVMSPVKE